MDLSKEKRNILKIIKASNFSDEGFFSLPEIKGYGYTKQFFLLVLFSLLEDGFISHIEDRNPEFYAPNDAHTLNLVAIEFKLGKNFDSLYKDMLTCPKEGGKKIKLSGKNIKFDNNKAIIYIGEQECPLPNYQNEHFLCRAIWKRQVGEFVDWSTLFEDMGERIVADNKDDAKKEKRSVQDAMYALNKRIKEIVNTNDNLFTWRNKSIKRNY